MFLKIVNLFNGEGTTDYKGLNIDLFKPHSQSYNFDDQTCVLETTENFKGHKDIIELTEEQYQEIVAYNIELNKTNDQKQLEVLEKKTEMMQKVIDELILGGVL